MSNDLKAMKLAIGNHWLSTMIDYLALIIASCTD